MMEWIGVILSVGRRKKGRSFRVSIFLNTQMQNSKFVVGSGT